MAKQDEVCYVALSEKVFDLPRVWHGRSTSDEVLEVLTGNFARGKSRTIRRT